MVTQTCGVCGKEIESGGMGGAPMCEHYKWNHPVEFFGSEEEIPPKYYAAATHRAAVHPDPGKQATLVDFA